MQNFSSDMKCVSNNLYVTLCFVILVVLIVNNLLKFEQLN